MQAVAGLSSWPLCWCVRVAALPARKTRRRRPRLPLAKTNAWVTTAAAALTLTRGNSETFLATLSLDTKAKWEKDEARLRRFRRLRRQHGE